MCFEIVDQVNFIVVPAYPRARFVFSASFFYCYAAFFFFFSCHSVFPPFLKNLILFLGTRFGGCSTGISQTCYLEHGKIILSFQLINWLTIFNSIHCFCFGPCALCSWKILG